MKKDILQLIDDYKRRRKTAKKHMENENMGAEDFLRLTGKLSTFNNVINELERIIRDNE